MGKLNVLLVDDEPNVLKSLKRVFIDTDYRILTAGSGKEGLEVCAREQVALVISDYRMPEMTGVQFLAEVKELYPKTIRIILSGFADVSAIVEAINHGQVYRFLSKPWKDNELIDTINHSLEYYRLREDNSTLLAELQVANQDLKELTDSLEHKVEERSRDLELQLRATQTAQRILNHVPAGVIGIDSQGTIVYMNAATSNYISTQHLALGEQISWQMIEEPFIHIKNILENNDVSELVFEEKGVRTICTSLPNRSGVIAMFSYSNLDDYEARKTTAEAGSEVTNVK